MSTSDEDNSAPGENIADEDNAALAAMIAAAAATSATSTRNAKPPDFIMGQYEEESQADCGDWHIVAGREPLADWSGIDATEPRSTFLPT